MIWLPTVENVLLLHQKLIDRSGGSAGVRDLGLIESALARAEAAFGGVEAHQGTIRKAAAVGCGLTQNHGFVDGNKRIGMAAMLLILRRNGVKLAYTQAELVTLGLEVAQGKADTEQVAAWIARHRTTAGE